MTVILCYLLAVNQVMAQTLKHQDKELEILKSENTTGQASYKQKKLEKSKNEFGFGNQLGDFSLNYLLFISHYIPGSLMPVVCRNPMTAYLTGGVGGVLPLIWLDNLVFSLGSIVSLYTELMIFDHLQSYYRKMEADMKGGDKCNESVSENDSDATNVTRNGSGSGSGSETANGNGSGAKSLLLKRNALKGGIVTQRKLRADLSLNDGSGSGSGSGTANTACTPGPEENLQLKGLELQYDALAHEIELLTMKADAIRATKAAWLLSAALSAVIGVVMVTTGAAAVTAGAAAGTIIGGELGYFTVSRPVGQAYGAAMGALYGAGVVEPMHSQTGDVCSPMFLVTGAYLGAVGINEAIIKYKADGEPHPDIKFPGAPKSSFNAPARGKEILPVLNRAKSFEELVYGLLEMLAGKGVTLAQHRRIQDELKKNGGFKVDTEDFLALKKYIGLALKEDFWKKSSELMQKLSLMDKAQATTVNTKDDQEEAADIASEAAEAESLGDGFNIFKDATAVFNTGTNAVNLTNESEIGADLRKVKENPVANGPEVISKYLSWDFFVKFANYLGFSNGGELAFLLYITMVGDLVVLKSRSWIIHPLMSYFYGIDGTWEAKLVSSLVAAYFANAYRKEVIEAKKKAIDFKIRVGEIITAMNRPGGGVPNPSGGQTSSAKGESAQLSSSAELKECINSSDLIGPQAVGPCQGQQNQNVTAFSLDSEGFTSAFGNIGAIAAGAAGNLGQALNRMSAGNEKGAQGELRNLGSAGPSLAAAIKSNLDLLSKKFPKKKINDRLSNLEKLYAGRIQNALRSAGLKAPTLAASPLSFATLASIAPPKEQKGNESDGGKDNAVLNKGTKPLLADYGGFKMDFAKGKPLPMAGGQISSYTKQDYQDAVKGNFEYKDDDIGQNTQEDIFKTITLRYFKTAYPLIFKKKD